MRITRMSSVALALVALGIASPARAEVTKFDVVKRSDVGTSGYEKIVGTAHFSIDPKDPRNRGIVNIDKAPVNAQGRVEFSTDVVVLQPKDQGRSNGVSLVDVVNRGRKTILRFNRVATDDDAGGAATPVPNPCPAAAAPPTSGAAPREDLTTDADLGDGFLTSRGYTLVFVGWQFDVRRRGGLLSIDLPRAKGVTGIVRATFTPCDRRPNQPVADLAGYEPLDPAGPDATLTVSDAVFGDSHPVPRDRWRLAGNVVTMEGGFEPGKIYEIAFKTADPPVAGLGLAAFRDMGAYAKSGASAWRPTRYAYTFGSSQSGRFLRAFLYEGFNSSERGAQVFDGVMAHIAGAGRLDVNRPWGTPNALGMFVNTTFPFATSSQRDPISGRTDGLLENDRARANQPKIFFTNTDVEYWGGGRAAALVHTTADGKADLPVAPNVRVYFLAGTQHSPGRFPARATSGAQPYNPVDYWWTLRALLVAMDKWVRDGVEPPASQHPKLADGTLVPASKAAFPAIPGVHSPHAIPAGREAGHPIPFLVPQVDKNGNDRAGIRLPEVAVPVATYTGWNFRAASTGGPDLLVNLMGSAIPLPKTKAERERSGDSRQSLEELYPSHDAYLTQVRDVAQRLAKDRYVLDSDIPQLVKRAEDHWGAARGTN